MHGAGFLGFTAIFACPVHSIDRIGLARKRPSSLQNARDHDDIDHYPRTEGKNQRQMG
ncbi:MAG TPA: hypothetical protein DEF41_06260 [Desulfovibrio sp.]|uniref:Uncharacterized protein n=1 Tax=Nitratidesulfovibrio vulgaris (strain ATCC 29579 / DSM 644 / CCUG 34227 / NCIMB 8303 / VKM B-1760 / Hildenborough) TaxID=882 RepID=Q72CJ1_NITV2|nr:hypothetical protein DVU_1292 [Nitratidesulfovibrio vulgaris str. Hildenborough]HBW15728.1 hypothetical protein [Desulfovibrio sp.]